MTTGRLNEIPMWASAKQEPPEYFLCRFPDLEMHLLQDCGLDVMQLPNEVLGLSGITNWIGEVENGGVSQYFANKISNNLSERVYQSNLLSDTLKELRCIGNSRFEDLFVETISLFVEESDQHVRPNMTHNLIRTEKSETLSKKIWQRPELQDFWRDYAKYARSLPNLKYISNDEFEFYVETLVSPIKLYKISNINQFSSKYLKNRQFQVDTYLQDRMNYDFRSDLEFIKKHIESLVSSRNA